LPFTGLETVEVIRPLASVADTDFDNMVQKLREQKKHGTQVAAPHKPKTVFM
jgi:hypothetical protein